MKKTAKWFAASLFPVFMAFSPLLAENISNDELIASAMAVAEGRATPRQQAIAFSNNDRINNLALTGKISNSVYQTNQEVFVKKNDELIRHAAGKSGMTVDVPEKQTKDYKPGTDTDRQLLGSGRELTVQNVKDARNNYNQAVADYLKQAGFKADSGTNWAARLTTDIMPSPHQMKPDAFREATRYINSQGGLAYNDPEAAQLQLDIDKGNRSSLTAAEAAAYHREMQRKIQGMNTEVGRLQKEKAGVTDPEKLENLDAEIRKHTAFLSKYVKRDNDVADLLIKETEALKERRKTGHDKQAEAGLNEGSYESNSSRLIAESQLRNASKKAIRGEAAVGAMNEQLAVKATRRVNDAIAGLANAGDKNTRAGEIIAANLKKLPVARQAEAIADLEVKYGEKMARSVAGELKKQQQTDSAEKNRPGSAVSSDRKQSVCSGLGLLNTALNVRNQYAEGKSTTEILWNMSFAGDLETVSRETSDYTSREIERLRQKYRAAGEDPESTATKLKILAEASIKGTIHGSLTGSYELLKSASKSVAGAALTAGDSAIFLVGEALDTGNVLDQALAEMKAQNMEQNVQNAKAARFGRQAVSELKRLAGEADYLKSVLEQNARSARMFCRDADAMLDELASLLRQSSEAAEIAKAVNLPELEKELMKKISTADRDIASLNRQAEIALKTPGDGPGAAEKTAKTLRVAADQQRSRLESAGAELEKMLGIVSGPDGKEFQEAAGVISARLIEQSGKASANAEVMRKNEAQYKKVLAAFDSLKSRVEEAEAFFADKRQSNEGDWMIIKSDIRQIARPEGRMPEAFFAEVGTLERLPDKIKSDLSRLKMPANSSGVVAESRPENEARVVKLAASLQTATDALTSLYATIEKIAAASSTPKQASDIRIHASQNAFVGETVQFRAELPAALSVSFSVGSSVRPAVRFDPYDGHDPESAHGMLALSEYKRAYESGRAEEYIAEKTGQKSSGSTAPVIEWFFDDNSGAGNNRGNPISHVFANPGRYNVTVKVYGANNTSIPPAIGKTVISITARDPQVKKTPPSQPAGDKLLPCGHRPGECPSPKSLKCSLHSGEISIR